jgi:hypothetical protein
MNPNLLTFVVLAGIILSLFAGDLFEYVLNKVISRIGPAKCRGEQCGESGRTVDSDANQVETARP